MHLSDEQFEEALRSGLPNEHAGNCPECMRRLEEMRAVRTRLQSAFRGVHAPATLLKRINASAAPLAAAPAPIRHHRFWPAIAAAAAVLILAASIGIYLSSGSTVQAAQQELVDIHQRNMSEGYGFTAATEPADLAAYFKNNLGFRPALPKLNQGMEIRGCCQAKFRGHIVGSYVVGTPKGVMSIIVVTPSPQELGLTRNDGTGIWTGAFAKNSLAACRVGDNTYCAVGEVPVENLTQLLSLLVR